MIPVDSLETRGRRRVALGTLWQILARLVGLVLGVVVSVALARGLGRTDFGWVALGLTVVGIGNILSDVGMTQAASRDIVARPGAAPRIAGALLLARSILGVLTLVVVVLVASTITHSELPTVAIFLLATSIVLSAPVALNSVFGAHLRPGLVGITGLTQSIVWAIAAVVCWVLHASLIWYAVGFVLATCVQSVLSILLTRRLQTISFKSWTIEAASLIRWSWTLCMGSLMFAIFQRGPMFVIQSVQGPNEMALFAGAWRFVDAAMLIPIAINTSLVPFATVAMKNEVNLRRMITITMTIGCAFAAGLFAIVLPVSEPLGRLLLSNEFVGIGPVLVLAMATFVSFSPDSVWGGLLIAAGRSRSLATTGAVAAAASVGLSLVLVPWIGVLGASISVLVAQTLRTVLLSFAARRLAGPPPWGRLLRIAVASSMTVTIGCILRDDIPVLATAAIEGMTYVGTVLALGAVQVNEARMILRRPRPPAVSESGTAIPGEQADVL
jgi:O-antigen/teichoic acid export membrane protein